MGSVAQGTFAHRVPCADPVVPADKAIYGHRGCGGQMEEDFTTATVKEQRTKIPIGPSLYWHLDLKLLLVVYVDALKRSGPSGSLAKGWAITRKHTKMGKVGPGGKYLLLPSQTPGIHS